METVILAVWLSFDFLMRLVKYYSVISKLNERKERLNVSGRIFMVKLITKIVYLFKLFFLFMIRRIFLSPVKRRLN